MTAIGKLLALLNLMIGLTIMAWSVSVYTLRPGWFADPPTGGVDAGNKPVGFKEMQAETSVLGRAAGLASEAWGTRLATLEAREQLRADRRAAYAQRLRWARAGNPKDPVDPANPKSPGKGFYEPVVDPATNLYDLTLAAGVPTGKAVFGTDGLPLPGLDGLLGTVAGDAAEIVNLTNQIEAQRVEFDKLSGDVVAVEARAVSMGVIRDSVQAELFFLSGFEVDVFETRETVFRRERQLRERLKVLGVVNP